MQKINIDYLLVGQGLAGSWLGYELSRRGFSIKIISKENGKTASLKAAGLYNPITGRKMIKSWRADAIFQHLEGRYLELEKLTQSKFLHPKSIYRPFISVEDLNDWEGKLDSGDYSDFVEKLVKKPIYSDNLINNHGGIMLKKCGYVDLTAFIPSMSSFFRSENILIDEYFDYQNLEISSDSINYKNITAKKIIFCEGSMSQNPFWEGLKFRPVRGEVMNVSCKVFSEKILNQGVFMIPKEGFYTVGSTYDHENLDFKPHPDGIAQLKSRFERLYLGSYEVKKMDAGVRPATYDRKPFIGFHPKTKNIAIFNGLGAKGVSLAPFFASHFADVLSGEAKLDKEIDVQRVY